MIQGKGSEIFLHRKPMVYDDNNQKTYREFRTDINTCEWSDHESKASASSHLALTCVLACIWCDTLLMKINPYIIGTNRTCITPQQLTKCCDFFSKGSPETFSMCDKAVTYIGYCLLDL